MTDLTPDKVLKRIARAKFPMLVTMKDEILAHDTDLARQLLEAREALRKLASEDRWMATVKGRDGKPLDIEFVKEAWSGELPPDAMGLIQSAWKIARACLPEHQGA